jgi:hypothetical protein
VGQDQPAGQAGVADGQVQGDKPAGRVAEDHRPVDAEAPAQGGHVVGHLLQGAGGQRRPSGAALAAT